MSATVKIEVLHAFEGDCIFISISDSNNSFTIMIDGGTKPTYQCLIRKKMIKDGPLKCKINELRAKGQKIDLLIITHVDEDHIGGIVEWMAMDDAAMGMLEAIWMNNGDIVDVPDYSNLRHSIPKGRTLDELLRKVGKKVENHIVRGRKFAIPHGEIIILTPTVAAHNVVAKEWGGKVLNSSPNDYAKPIKELLNYDFDTADKSKTNKSSIAFILEVEGRKDLFLGDADISDVCDSLECLGYNLNNPICCKTVKLAHHGSRNNFSDRLLGLVKADVFIFSSNGDYYGHPDKEVFARIIAKTNASVYFNYKERADRIVSEQDKKDYSNIKNRILGNLDD